MLDGGRAREAETPGIMIVGTCLFRRVIKLVHKQLSEKKINISNQLSH